jgi:PEGA domain
MSRIRLAAAVAAVVGVSLTGCSSSSNSSSEQLQALKFESDPPGAEIHTPKGQTCFTPCALTVPSQEQSVAITKDGYVPQTVQVTSGPQPEHSFWENPPPTLAPNPVHVVLQRTKPVHAVGHTAISAASTRTSNLSPPPTAPPPQGPAASALPPSPSKQ